MAIVKKHDQTVKCFEKSHGKDKIVAESAKFGKIYENTRNNQMVSFKNEALTNAVYSGQYETISYVQLITNHVRFPSNVEDHVLDREILSLTGNSNDIKTSVLVDFSKEFPLFNEDIENPEKKSLTIPWPQLCCMQNIGKSTIHIQDIEITNTCSK